MNTQNLTRRNFLKHTATVTGGLILAFHLPPSTRVAQAAETTAAADTPINAWLRISSSDTITVLVAHSEMGQGVYTSLPMLIAEELEADWKQIKVEMSPTGDLYKNPLIGQQLTGGSTAVRARWEGLRQAGAAAREMLIQAAATQWQVPAAECQASQGKVTHPGTGKSLTYGQLAEAAAKLTPPATPKLKTSAEFKLIGKPIKRLDTPAKVDGSAVYGIDVRLPNMLYATVQQSPVFGNQVEGYNKEVAKDIKVVPLDNGLAVVADSYWEAKRQLDSLQVRFPKNDAGPQDSQGVTQLLQQALTEPGVLAHGGGNLAEALKKAKQTLTAEYSVPFLAHATMEPINCTASVTKDQCEIWVPTQAQQQVQTVAAKITGFPKEKIIVHTTYLGGGFGRRAESDFVAQAVTLSKEMGKPVKVLWSREEDLQHDFYRPAMMAKLTAGLNDKGVLTAWQIHLVGPSILSRWAPPMVKDNLDPFVTEGISELPYDIANQAVHYVMKNTQVPVGFWRSVAHTHNAFFVESFMDEIAHATGKDPYQFRRDLLSLQPRHLKVLETLAERANWDKPLPQGRYRGLALQKSFGSIVGEVAEISLNEKKEVKVHKVTCVVDCGMVVNPNIVEAQMEGGIIYGLSGLTQAITLKAGRVEQSNFDNYLIPRMAEMPIIDVHILPSEEPPGGAGEPSTPPIIPSVTNAIFAATGQRIRHLPLTTEMLRKTASMA